MREYGSEFDLHSNKNYCGSGSNQYISGDAVLFRSGRDALKAVAVRYKYAYRHIVLPALCCQSMVSPFRKNGYEVSYYRLNADLTADTGDVIVKLKPAAVFLYMNYFGIQALSTGMLQTIRERFPDLIMLEDRTHDILSPGNGRFTPDYTVCSIRKWLAVPDGGILYAKSDKAGFDKKDDKAFSDIRLEALKNKSEYLEYGDLQKKELFRRQLAQACEYLDNDEAVVGMSAAAYEILRNTDFKKIAEARLENIRALSRGLKYITEIKQLAFHSTDKVMPYYPVIVKERDRLQKLLAGNGIYCPVIWPLPPDAAGVCGNSGYMSEHMLALPCDQRYSTADMEYISESLKSIGGITA